MSSGPGHATRGALFPAYLNGIAHATPVTICAALLAHRAAPPAPSLVIERFNAPVNTLTVQPVSGATITAQYYSQTSPGVNDLYFPGLSDSFVRIQAYVAVYSPYPYPGSLSCTASCGVGCIAPTLPASKGLTSLEFNIGTTYTVTCHAVVPGSTTTTKSFTLVVPGAFVGNTAWSARQHSWHFQGGGGGGQARQHGRLVDASHTCHGWQLAALRLAALAWAGQCCLLPPGAACPALCPVLALAVHASPLSPPPSPPPPPQTCCLLCTPVLQVS